MSHSILLIQPSTPETRTYSDYESVNDCLEGVCRIFEENLKRRNPNTVRKKLSISSTKRLIYFFFQPTITYDISQLFDFVDQLKDLSVLVYQKSTNTYGKIIRKLLINKIQPNFLFHSAIQQGMDQGKNLRSASQSRRHIMN
jgi:hypothetical protein